MRRRDNSLRAFIRCKDGAAIWDQAFDGDDHGQGLDLGGSAVAGPFGVQVGDFPEPSQDLLAAQVQPAHFLSLLLHEPFVYSGPVAIV